MPDLHEYAGNIHIHTRFSDGTGTVAQVIRAAQAAGLDFIIITDHRSLAARQHQGWYNKLLVLAGEELGGNTGHYLGLGLTRLSQATLPREMIQAVAARGGLGIIAHPHDVKLPWPDWGVTGFDGISLWNSASQWRAAMQNPWHWPVCLPFPTVTLTAPPLPTRMLWDSLHRPDRLMPAIGSSDAHAFGFRPCGLPLVILSYRMLFRAINTHVLLRQPLTGRTGDDERLILAALRRGSSFIANHRQGQAKGFRFWAEGNGRAWPIGDTAPQGSVRRLRVILPGRGRIVLLRDGRELDSAYGRELCTREVPAGIYRVEVYRDAGRRWGWIFSNPIRLADN